MIRPPGNREKDGEVVNNSESLEPQPNCNVPFDKNHNVSPPHWSPLHWLPSFLISSVRYLSTKIDELSAAVVSTNQIDMVCITETWLCSSIPDAALSLGKCTFIRNDRTSSTGCGVCIFINNKFIVNVLQASKTRPLNHYGYLLCLNEFLVRSPLYCWQSSIILRLLGTPEC